MLVKHHSIAQHMRKIYYHFEKYIKKIYFGPCQAIAITKVAWTSPNNVPFMSLTGHFISEDWQLMDLTLGIAEIKGEVILIGSIKLDHIALTYYILGAHDAKNFANIIIEHLAKFDLTKKLYEMTADNISTNVAIG